MEHFARIIMEKQKTISLNEAFSDCLLYETAQGNSIMEIPLEKSLNESESFKLAEKIADYLFAQGYDDFDIEISTDDAIQSEEITLENVNDLYEEFGILGYSQENLWEAEYQGRKVKLNKPIRSSDGPKKFHVYVKDPKTGNVKKVNFGDPDSKIKKSNPERRRSFRARHNCDNPGPKTSARYWSCKAW